MSTLQVPATPAHGPEQTRQIDNPIFVPAHSETTDPRIFQIAGSDPHGVVTDEEDLVDPSALIERLMCRLSHLLAEVEPVATEGLAAVLVEALQPLIAELMAVHGALRVGMKVEEWTVNFLRTAEISCEIGQIQELLSEYMDSVGVAWTDESNAEPTAG